MKAFVYGQAGILMALVLGIVIGGAAIWYLGPVGPHSGPKTLPAECRSLDGDYQNMVTHLMAVSPLGVQLRNSGGFDATWVQVRVGEGDRMYVDNPGIEATWEPKYDQLSQQWMDDLFACRDAFPDEFRGS